MGQRTDNPLLNGGEKSVQDERFSLPFVIDKNDMCDTLLFSY